MNKRAILGALATRLPQELRRRPGGRVAPKFDSTGALIVTGALQSPVSIDGIVVRDRVTASDLPAGLSASEQLALVQRLTFDLSGAVIQLPIADQFGGIKVCTFAAPMQFVGVSANLTFTHANLIGDASTVQIGLGSEVAGGLGGDDVVSVSAATGAANGAWSADALFVSTSDPGLVELWLNAAAGVAMDPGTLTLQGQIVLLAIEAAAA